MDLPSNFVDEPPDKLVIALQFWDGDLERAMRLARLLADIEPRRRDDAIFAFCRRFDTAETDLAWQTFLHVGSKFGVMRIRSAREAIGHPDGSFGLFAGTLDALSEAWLAGQLRARSVLMVEADGAPLRTDWIDVLKDEHGLAEREGKRVSGPVMNRPNRHVNGTLCMDLSLWADRPSLHRCPPAQAFDLFHASAFMQECRPTTQIKNIYGAKNYSPGVLTALAKETAWLASTKDDSVLEWAERTLVTR